VTKQTGGEGKVVRRLYVEGGSKIERELYLALLVDRSTQKVAILGSTAGGNGHRGGRGHDAGEDPHRAGHPLVGVCDFQARDLGLELGLKGKLLWIVRLAACGQIPLPALTWTRGRLHFGAGGLEKKPAFVGSPVELFPL